jgi:ribosome recycling factor
MSIDKILKMAKERMASSITALHSELGKLRTGRVHTGLVEHIKVESYGSIVPLMQVASIVVEDAKTLLISAWDKSQINAIEKAIIASDLGLNPVVSGVSIRIVVPALTQERRDQLAKLVRGTGETTKVAIRNIRRDVINELKALKKDKEITEDDERQVQVQIQKITDDFIDNIDKILAEKELELQAI